MYLKIKLENAINHIKQFSTRDEKVNYLLGDHDISKAIYDIALEMAKSGFYHDEEELVIFPAAIKTETVEENLLPEAPKPKKVSPLN